MNSKAVWGAVLGALLSVLPLLTRAQDGALGSTWMAKRSYGQALWAGKVLARPGSAPVSTWDLALADGHKPQPFALLGPRPRISLTARMRFATTNPNSLGYCAKLGFFDQPGNVVQMGACADVTNPLSVGTPLLRSETVYVTDVGQGQGPHGEYRPFEFKPNTWYNLELRYLDDQHVAQLWIDGKMQHETPLQLIDRIFVTLQISALANGDQISADFQNVTVEGHIPGRNGNGNGNEVILNGPWNTQNTSPQESHGLSIRQTRNIANTDDWSKPADFHGEGTVAGAPPVVFSQDPHYVWSVTTALNTEYWFGQ